MSLTGGGLGRRRFSFSRRFASHRFPADVHHDVGGAPRGGFDGLRVNLRVLLPANEPRQRTGVVVDVQLARGGLGLTRRGSPQREDSPPYFRALQGKNSNLRNHHLFR